MKKPKKNVMARNPPHTTTHILYSKTKNSNSILLATIYIAKNYTSKKNQVSCKNEKMLTKKIVKKNCVCCGYDLCCCC
jgi:hypothetical protein